MTSTSDGGELGWLRGMLELRELNGPRRVSVRGEEGKDTGTRTVEERARGGEVVVVSGIQESGEGKCGRLSSVGTRTLAGVLWPEGQFKTSTEIDERTGQSSKRLWSGNETVKSPGQ